MTEVSMDIRKKNNRKNKILLLIFLFVIILSVGFPYCDLKYENRILKTRLSNIKNEEEKFIHFSIDDVINIFEDIEKHHYDSIFENRTLNYLKKMHDLYGLKVSMNCFYAKGGFNLSMCSEKYKNQYEKNSSWLKFGFHALDGNVDYNNLSMKQSIRDFNLVMTNLSRIVGEKSIDNVIRIHQYHAKEGFVSFLSKNGVEGLLSPDDERFAYYLDSTKSSYIRQFDYYNDKLNCMMFYQTDARLEQVKSVNEKLTKISNDSLIGRQINIFTHEWLIDLRFKGWKMKRKIKEVCEFAVNSNYEFVFL